MVCCICAFSPSEELIPALFSTLANPENSPNIVDGVSSWFEITAPHEMTFNLDGEPLSGKTFRMELLPSGPALLSCRPTARCYADQASQSKDGARLVYSSRVR